MKTKHTLLTGLALLSLPAVVQAQLHIAGGGFHIASGAVVAVRGDVTSNGTDITGDGTLMLNGTGAQNLGMSGGDIPVLEVNNSNNVTLTSAARVEDALTLTAGNVLLGNNNLIFDPSATAAGAVAGRALVTNGTGFVQKEDLANGASFTFPVAVAAGELTQAVVTNNVATVRDFSTQVKTYAQSGATEGNPANGIDRTWQIFADVAGAATVALQHNASSEGSNFNRNDAFVTRTTSTGEWTLGAGESAKAPLYTHDSALSVPALADATSYFSKSDDEVNSLNTIVAVQPAVVLQGSWNGSSHRTDLRDEGVIPLTQPYNVAPHNYSGPENVDAIPAGVTDWVLVELRSSANVGVVVSRRAAFVKSNKQIVDLDGTSPLTLRGPSGNYYLSVTHRNHLFVASANPLTLGTAPTSYDFSTSLSQALNNGNNTQMRQVSPGVWAMYVGDFNNDEIIDGLDRNGYQGQVNLVGYYDGDFNMDSFVDGLDLNLFTPNVNAFSPLY